MVMYACNPWYLEGWGRNTMSFGQPYKFGDILSAYQDFCLESKQVKQSAAKIG